MPSRPSTDVHQLVCHDVAAGLGPDSWSDMMGSRSLLKCWEVSKICQTVNVFVYINVFSLQVVVDL